MQYKIGDKIRFYRNWSDSWRYTTIEKIEYNPFNPDEPPILWGYWHDLGCPPDPEMSFIRANAKTLELVKRGGACPMETKHG